MKFKLLYVGDILTNPKKRAQHITDIRMQFHPQLKKLVNFNPWDNLTKYMVPEPTKSPIITPNLKMIAELEILLMHPEIVGMPHSDIDNRVKTILDGLRCPQNEHEIGQNTPRDIGPIYTLLDDDHLVTKLTVNTSHLLAEDFIKHCHVGSSDSVVMLIDVIVRVTEGTLENLPFMV